MTNKIHIVKNNKGELEIIDSSKVRHANLDYKVYYPMQQTYPYKISKIFYDDDGEPSYYDEYVKIEHTFTVMTKGEFILNDGDNSKLNACIMSGGFNQINRLAYSYSVAVIKTPNHQEVWESDLVYTESGIKATRLCTHTMLLLMVNISTQKID